MFKKGVSGNPSGRPKVTDEERYLRTVNQRKIEDCIDKYAHMTKEQLKAILQNEQTVMLDLMFVSVMYKCAITGDWTRLESLMNRRVGKVKTTIEISGKDGGPIQSNVTELSNEELAKEAAKIEKKLKQLE